MDADVDKLITDWFERACDKQLTHDECGARLNRWHYRLAFQSSFSQPPSRGDFLLARPSPANERSDQNGNGNRERPGRAPVCKLSSVYLSAPTNTN